MAKPRVFVSSTYYDLKHVRSSLDNFIESLGFESVLSEKGGIAFTPETPLDVSCYREAGNADIFVLIIGGRYGSEVSGEEKRPDRSFFERYDSITKKEYESAVKRDIPVYVLIEANVHSEYQTYLRNKDSKDVSYAHVDSVNIFRLIEEILAQPRNNPVHTFERFADIQSWLREQWAGFFRELLQKESQRQQLATLTSEVSELRGISDTLKRYLEAVMRGVKPGDSDKLIESEKKRLERLELRERIKGNRWCGYVMGNCGVSFEDFYSVMERTRSFDDFARLLGKVVKDREKVDRCVGTLMGNEKAKADFDEIQSMMGLRELNEGDRKKKMAKAKAELPF